MIQMIYRLFLVLGSDSEIQPLTQLDLPESDTKIPD